jgi:hypothetical protein
VRDVPAHPGAGRGEEPVDVAPGGRQHPDLLGPRRPEQRRQVAPDGRRAGEAVDDDGRTDGVGPDERLGRLQRGVDGVVLGEQVHVGRERQATGHQRVHERHVLGLLVLGAGGGAQCGGQVRLHRARVAP